MCVLTPLIEVYVIHHIQSTTLLAYASASILCNQRYTVYMLKLIKFKPHLLQNSGSYNLDEINDYDHGHDHLPAAVKESMTSFWRFIVAFSTETLISLEVFLEFKEFILRLTFLLFFHEPLHDIVFLAVSDNRFIYHSCCRSFGRIQMDRRCYSGCTCDIWLQSLSDMPQYLSSFEFFE